MKKINLFMLIGFLAFSTIACGKSETDNWNNAKEYGEIDEDAWNEPSTDKSELPMNDNYSENDSEYIENDSTESIPEEEHSSEYIDNENTSDEIREF